MTDAVEREGASSSCGGAFADVQEVVSQCWPGWRVERLIGSGEHGRVFEAVKDIAGKETLRAAIKVIEVPRPGAAERDLALLGLTASTASDYYEQLAQGIIEEIGVMNALRGESNIVLIEDAAAEAREDGRGWIVVIRMELLQGLAERQEEFGRFSAAEAACVARDVARALVACGRQGVVHRDVKPSNVFWSERLGQYKLGDFGVARSVEDDMKTVAGTSCYMAPELYLPDAAYGPNVDVYALGILLFNLLNDGRPPFAPAFPEPIGPADVEESERRRLRGERLPDARNADGYLSDVVRRAADPDPETRIQTAEELLAALEAWPGWSGEDGGSGDAGGRKLFNRRTVLVAGAGVVVAAALGAAGTFGVFEPAKPAKGLVEIKVALDGWADADGIAFVRFAPTGAGARSAGKTVAVRKGGNESIQLEEGAYDVALAASPVYADGTVFYPDAGVQSITVPEGKRVSVEIRGEKRESPRCVGAPLISDADVREFDEAADASGIPEAAVEPYRRALNLALQKYLAGEMEGRVLYEGEGSPVLQAGTYSFKLARSWEGKVEAKCTDQGFTVYPVGLANAPVLEARMGNSSDTVDESVNLLVREFTLGNDRSVFVTAPDYCTFAETYSEGLIPDDVLETCLNLISDGTLTLEQARQSGSSGSSVETFMSPGNVLTPQDAVDAAFEELAGTNGWFFTLPFTAISKSSPSATFASFSENRLVLFGSMDRAETKSGLFSDYAASIGPRVWAFEVSDDAAYEIYGAIDGPKQSVRDEFFSYVTDLVGLGLRLEVVDGVIVRGELSS